MGNTKTDLAVFNEFFSEHKSNFMNFAYMYIRDRDASEDIVMEAMMSYWENRHKIMDNSNALAFVLTVVKNRCLNYLKQKKTHRENNETLQMHESWKLDLQISTLEALVPSDIFSKEIQDLVHKTLSGLNKRSRDIFMMSRYDNMSNKEIAERLNISVKAVEYHITLCLKRLRIALKDYICMILFFL